MTDVSPIISPEVSDFVDVGTEKILESHHISEGRGRLASAPVPSVFIDERGEIHRIVLGDKRVNLLFSKKGVMRSGYLHPNNTHRFVITGTVEVWYLTKTKGTEKKIYGSQEYFVISPYNPVILNFLDDSSILEWNEPGPFRCWYYHPYRRIIDVQNSRVTQSTGRFSKLVPQDIIIPTANDGKYGKYLWMATGMVCGAVIGILVGSRPRV